MFTYPSLAAARDRFVVEHRPPRLAVTPARARRVFVEDERSSTGALLRVATTLLTGRECPWHCAMCDLWQHTTVGDTPGGAIAAQVADARASLATTNERGLPAWPVDVVKLYNAGSFFDPRAVPEHDYGAVARTLAGVGRVIVESHPALLGARALRFRDLLKQADPEAALEVAIGLETVHPEALDRLNKRMTADDFAAGAVWLTRHGLDVRVFLLIAPPFVPPEEHDHWLLRSVDLAVAAGATAVSLIPTRTGNGAIEVLQAEGLFHPPSLDDIERSVDLVLRHSEGRSTRRFVDLWDLARFSTCHVCFDARRTRLQAMNHAQRTLPRVGCDRCGSGRA